MTNKILVFEDNEQLRESLCALVGVSENLELVGAYENCKDVLNHIICLEPDLVLMDIDMPLVNGIEGLKIIRAEAPELPVIMLTVFEDNKHILEAIIHGATGYILKQHLTTKLEGAIEEALDGGVPLSPVVAKLLFNQVRKANERKKDYGLTAREKDILLSLTDGNSYKMIAAALGISQGTVCSHIKNVYEKLGVHSQSEAVSKTLKEGLV